MVFLDYFLSYTSLQQALELCRPVSPSRANKLLDSDSISCMASECSSLMDGLAVISFIKSIEARRPRCQTPMCHQNSCSGKISISS